MRISNSQIRIVSLLLVFYYIIMAWLLHRSGYEHSESLFYAEKLKLLFEYKENTLLTLGTTYPSTFFIGSIVFSPFGYLFAPIATSIVMMSVLYFFMVKDINDSNLPIKTLFICITILFFLHPMFIFSAVSGRNVAGIMLFFYMLFRSLFNYYKSQTTYYLSLASIYLTGLIFTEINFLWMLLSFFPFVMLISIEGIKVSKEEPFVFQYFQALNNRSLRRKLANRTVALYLILFLLPLGAVYLFRTLNAAHAGDATYFLTSQYANWRVTGTTALNTILEGVNGSNISMQTQIIFQTFTVFLAPLFILSLILFRGKLYELFTILTPLIFFSIILVDVKYYFTVEYYIIINLIGIAALTFFGAERFGKKLTPILLVGTTVLSLFAGVYYFNETNDQEEQDFLSSLTKVEQVFEPKKSSELQQVADYVATVATNKTPVLIDDASAFGIVAHLQTLDGLVLPMQKSFVTVIENPVLTAQYIVVAKRNNRLHNFTVLNAYNIGIMKERLKLSTYRVFETNNWIIYSIR
ncbi:MAG: hypothetical protein Q8K64_04235 [Sediminibacterium sp.]|nr:hypothetical protein [Sediminibacterium sp.]TXT34921.1 MAG: hypothetical protein FD136_29 [Chitinophagaceae bacterium]